MLLLLLLLLLCQEKPAILADCWVCRELAHPGQECKVSCIKRSQSKQKICSQLSHMYTYNKKYNTDSHVN